MSRPDMGSVTKRARLCGTLAIAGLSTVMWTTAAVGEGQRAPSTRGLSPQQALQLADRARQAKLPGDLTQKQLQQFERAVALLAQGRREDATGAWASFGRSYLTSNTVRAAVPLLLRTALRSFAARHPAAHAKVARLALARDKVVILASYVEALRSQKRRSGAGGRTQVTTVQWSVQDGELRVRNVVKTMSAVQLDRELALQDGALSRARVEYASAEQETQPPARVDVPPPDETELEELSETFRCLFGKAEGNGQGKLQASACASGRRTDCEAYAQTLAKIVCIDCGKPPP